MEELENCQRRLGLANRLIAALASEGERWEATVQQLEKDYKVGSKPEEGEGLYCGC